MCNCKNNNHITKEQYEELCQAIYEISVTLVNITNSIDVDYEILTKDTDIKLGSVNLLCENIRKYIQ